MEDFLSLVATQFRIFAFLHINFCNYFCGGSYSSFWFVTHEKDWPNGNTIYAGSIMIVLSLLYCSNLLYLKRPSFMKNKHNIDNYVPISTVVDHTWRFIHMSANILDKNYSVSNHFIAKISSISCIWQAILLEQSFPEINAIFQYSYKIKEKMSCTGVDNIKI